MDYASKGVGAAGLTTGIIGTALGAVNSGLFGGILGGNPAMMGCSDNQPVTRHEMGLENQIAAKDSKIALLESTIYTDGKFDKLKEDINAKFAAVEQQLCEQKVWNTAQTGAISCMQSQVNALLSLTKMVIPNTNVCPGWGDVTVSVTPAATAAATT